MCYLMPTIVILRLTKIRQVTPIENYQKKKKKKKCQLHVNILI